ncbi:Uncharacterized protein Rs2_37520 [Raphanus sativus]|uniref:Uncharacterized protein LOC108832651 n=1 Tax=Raphanus sativus TaxID=3726 RepID=A0A6J0LP94_RAPSA|nr:uncharacterized protein LOC108832651 [Raphanus sativus]KAJ4880465.1 Uncharacterized protein Rs2_37520 [Raphanus sativus]
MVMPVKKSSAIRPVEFYGNSLPRPRFFDNPKFNSHRVDPPLSVLDPLLSWAREAHWSMGGLNFTRLRLQGRIEGNVDKLRAQLEKSTPTKLESGSSDKKRRSGYDSDSDSPPAAPVAVKRRRYIDLNDDADEEEIGSEDEGVARIRRKLSDDFDRVAGESKVKVVKAIKKPIESGSEGKRLKEKKTQNVEETSSTRTSPRLAKRRSST